ncbi:MAG TPA: NHL repeat-containing protein, partial [Nonomuraea sp.]|nr:NHL repeat-containing protein [Nonomuraea sp.]
VVRLLQREGIAYVAIEDAMRTRNFVQSLNEALFAATLEPVFSDPDNRYGHLDIYRVPQGAVRDNELAIPGPTPIPVSMRTGGRGAGPGQFVDPRGIAVAPSGEILVADAGNHRIQRFTADGTFIASVGGKGSQPGRFNEPSGIAVDSRGHVYVADAANHRLQELDASLAFVRAWAGPEPGFYGPRDVAVGSDDTVYVLDQGHARVARMTRHGTITTFGSFGAGPGQLDDPTGLAVAGNQVFVADPGHGAVQVFGTDGQFVRSIPVGDWSSRTSTADVAVTADGRRLYASSPGLNLVLVIPLAGGTPGSLQPTGAEALLRPSALALRADGQLLVVSFDAPRVSILPPPGP